MGRVFSTDPNRVTLVEPNNQRVSTLKILVIMVRVSDRIHEVDAVDLQKRPAVLGLNTAPFTDEECEVIHAGFHAGKHAGVVVVATALVGDYLV